MRKKVKRIISASFGLFLSVCFGLGMTSCNGEKPVDPTPVDPTPVDPTPTDPVDPTPVDPAKEKFSVILDTDGGTMSAEKNYTIEAGKTMDEPAEEPIKIGERFIGWYYEDKLFDFTTPVASDMTLKAVYEADSKTYTISFNSNEGSDVEAITGLKRNETGTAPKAPTKKNYDFLGWYLDGKPYDFTAPVTKNIKLVARWALSKITVSFDSQGGSLIPNQVIESGTKASRPGNPTKADAEFIGWYYQDEQFDFDQIINLDDLGTTQLTLTAKWENTYTVTFLNPDASYSWQKAITIKVKENMTVESQFNENEDLLTPDAGFSHNGYYQFLGWFAEGEEQAFDITSMITSSITLYAKWDKYYTVSFANADIEQVVIHEGEYAEAPEVQADEQGHPFDNWYYDGTVFDFANTPIMMNMVITARYKYYMDFNSVGGTDVSRQTIPYGQYAQEPESPVKEHYHFLGWYNSGQAYNFSANAITEDITLTARWTYVFYGDGTKESPFLIENKTDVMMLSELINKDAQHPVSGAVYRTSYFKLTASIDMEGELFQPISHFQGTLDGNGYAITNFVIETAPTAKLGFFSELDSLAVVRNLELGDVTISGDKASGSTIGLLAGEAEGASLWGCKVSGSIVLNEKRMERAVIGGLIGKISDTEVYAAYASVDIQGGNLVGGIVGYATNQSVVASSYASDLTKIQLYRTGNTGGLAGHLDEGSMFVSCYTQAKLMDSVYTAKTDSKTESFGFGDGSFVNCHSGTIDTAVLGWNSQDWDLTDLSLKLIPEEHNPVKVSIGTITDNEFVEQSSAVYDFGTVLSLDAIEGPAGYVFVGYKVNGQSVFDENAPVYSDIQLVPYYETYESMLGKWVYAEGEWFELDVNEAGNLVAKASVYTGTYDTTGSNFSEIALNYKTSAYEILPYVTYDSYGYASITGNSYEGVVIYFTVRSTITGAADEEYRVYLQRIAAGSYDKAFMRLEKKKSGEWELTNDMMLPFASDYSGYYIASEDSSEKLFIKAPYIPVSGNYNQKPNFAAADTEREISYSPFLFIGLEGYDDVVLGFTTMANDALGDYIYMGDGWIKQIYSYEVNEETNIDYRESFEYLNGRWFNDEDAYDYVYSEENTLEFEPKDPYHVYEMAGYNHVISVDEDNLLIIVDGQSFTYEKSLNEEGVEVLSYTDTEGNTHLFWADYAYSFMTGISYFVHYQSKGQNGYTKEESWEKYDMAMSRTWSADQPDEGDTLPDFGDLVITNTTIQLGSHTPVAYDFVYLTDCDGIPGWEIRSFDYLRFIVDGQTFYLREHTSTGYVYLYYEDSENPGHLLSRRYKDEQSFVYYDTAYAGKWIAKDSADTLTVDTANKTINGNAFTYSWYTPTDYDYELLGNNARYYNRVACFTMDGEEYQLRCTYVRNGYGYLYRKAADGTFELVSEYFSRTILDKLVGTWNYYDGIDTDTIEVTYEEGVGYKAYYNGSLMDSHLAWNGYNAAPVISYKLDDGEKVELLHLVYAGAYGYDLMNVLDYDSYTAVYDPSEDDMVYEYTNKYLYFKDTTIADVVETMSGTWTDGTTTVTIKNDEIIVNEPGYEPITLSIAYTYDLPSAFMEQYVVIMVGVDGNYNANYMFYYYNHYVSMTHFIDDETSTGGSLVRRDDIMCFRGNFTSVALNQTHNILFDGVTLLVDGFEFDTDYISYDYAMLNDGRVVPVLSFEEIVELDSDNLTAVIRSGEMYYIDGVMTVNLTDTHLTLSISGGSLAIESYDKVENLLVQEIFYDSDVLQYNGIYEFTNAETSNPSKLILNDGYVYVDGVKVEADILVLADGSIQVKFMVNQTMYYALMGLDAYGESVYSVFAMTPASL